MDLDYYVDKLKKLAGLQKEYKIPSWKALLAEIEEIAWMCDLRYNGEEADVILEGLNKLGEELLEDHPELFI